MRSRKFAPALAIIFYLTGILQAQSQHVNNGRRFNANGVYSGFDIDTINLFVKLC